MSAMTKIIVTNKRAAFDYEIIEKFEAGIVLTGPEVKSVKQGHISIKEAFATFKNGEIYLTNAHITPYKQAANIIQEPTRSRKLLLKKSEIDSLIGRTQSQGLTLVPTTILARRGLIKVEIALGRGRKKFDKREVIRKREQRREIEKETRRR